MSFEDKQHVCSDCWITARDAERERIVKLLEDQQIRFISNGFWTEGVAVRASIALIKGENK